MLQLTIPASVQWDEEKEEFVSVGKPVVLQLEHSLVSLSKWEAKWKKPYLTKETKSNEEVLDYIRCMTLTQNVKPEVYKMLTNEHMLQINEYINDPMTATTIKQQQGKRNNEQVTSELIYYWMTALNIPSEYQKWHLNRLLTLIEVASIKSQGPKKMDKKTAAKQNHSLNAARRAKMHSSG